MTFERVVEIRVENEPLETDMRKKRENCPKRETPCLALLPGNCDGGPTYMQGPFFFMCKSQKNLSQLPRRQDSVLETHVMKPKENKEGSSSRRVFCLIKNILRLL